MPAPANAGHASLEGFSPQEIASMAALTRRLGSDPKTAKGFQKLVKEVVPDFHAPELEMDQRIEAATKAAGDRVEKLEQELQQRDARERLNSLEREAMQHGVSETELRDGSFQKWATEQGFAINQLSLAAQFRANQNAMAVPSPAMPVLGAPDMTGDKLAEVRKGGQKGWDDYLRGQTNQFLTERTLRRQTA